MDWITFGSNLIDSTAWPLAVVIVVCWLKGHIKELLPFVRKVRIGNTEFELAEMTGRKVGEKVEKVVEGAEDTFVDVLLNQGIPEEKIKTLKEGINKVLRDTIQKTIQVQKDVEAEAIQKSIIGLVKANPFISERLLAETATDLYAFPKSSVIFQIDKLVGEGKIISSVGDISSIDSFLTLPIE